MDSLARRSRLGRLTEARIRARASGKALRMIDVPASRRPIRTRQRAWARAMAGWLGRRGVAPNGISLASVAAASGAGACLVLIARTDSRGVAALLAILAGCGIQLRLLANMLDGLVAVEGGRHQPTGDLFNEVPDRLADVVILVAAGYAISWFAYAWLLGWTAALAALFTAYVRLLGGSLGLPQDYSGPMAKSHRMAVLTAACVATAVESAIESPRGYAIAVGLVVVIGGSILTCGRRLRHIAAELVTR
jgi:phosphatidylglycerophosphate synthase